MSTTAVRPNHRNRDRLADPETVYYSSPDVRVGSFRCPLDHPDFRTAGPIEGYTVVFPRSSVWIDPDGHPPFVADPSLAVFYNLGQPYSRRAIAPDGDRSDWFSLSRPAAEQLLRDISPDLTAAEPFTSCQARIPVRLYYHQRTVFEAIRTGRLAEPLAIEEAVTVLLGTALRHLVRPARQPRPPARPRDLVERVRSRLAAEPFARPTVRALADQVGVSPFYLCRVFRDDTGRTLHDYLLEIRTRAVLERLDTAADLSRLAFEAGFSSHSHFTAQFRRRLGLTPSAARRGLGQATRSA